MQWPPGFLFPACVSVWVSCVSGANAWQQEYIAIDTKSNTSERYTWDSDHQPRYEDILAERMKSSETPGGLALNQGLAPPDSSRGMSVGWNYLLANGMTSGPVASLRSDVTAPATKRGRDGLCQHARLAHGLSVAVGRASLGAGEL
jgi:uncharacterized protein YhjY with autotransporter beta-barrel domain